MPSDFVLTDQLNAYMQAIPETWAWSELARLFSEGESQKEYRGPETNPVLIFTLNVLEDDVQNGRRYLHILVSVSDTNREHGQLGSSYTPLGTTFIWNEDGEIDMPRPEDIYQCFRE
ncbi:MAG: hypothetical protein KTR18_14660 [Acidiferrobacterales bacterium]|nr:hypothetical protein [Acidiferrobacterales bacterium]